MGMKVKASLHTWVNTKVTLFPSLYVYIFDFFKLDEN